jgi:phenylalanyl-tRNA synthetase beta chain
MKISLSWLHDYLKTTQTAEALAETLTRSGIEVKSITTSGASIASVIVVQILSSEQHPNADRLCVCKVDEGSGVPRQIVCGAKNYKVGDKVLLALPGAVLPGGIKIKVGKLRGVESEGMMCSAKELGLGEGGEGLHILDPKTVIGTEFGALFPSDTILELEITPNRPDWLGHVGVAREAAAFGAGEFFRNEVILPLVKKESSRAAIEDSHACSFYSLRSISNTAVKTSPSWLQQRLEAIGLRSINNIVDVTNYVMMEMGHPLHAFDADKIQGALTVRFATEGEKISLLDGKTYLLRSSDLVIADEKGAQALAGIIGGLESSVTKETKSILLESAVFNSSMIRASARAHGLATDASYRFERGSQADNAREASARATAMIIEISGAVASHEVSIAGEMLLPTEVLFRFDRCRQLLGISLQDEEISLLLKKFGLFSCDTGWQIPPWRLDLTREIDLIEEVARLYGLESIKARTLSFSVPSSPTDKIHDFMMLLRRRLIASGFYEARTSALVPLESSSSEALRLRNPLGEQQSVLRAGLISGLQEVVKHNLYQGAHSVRMFEMGKVFGNITKEEERILIGLIMTGNALPLSWREEVPRSLDLFDLKGVLDHLVPGKMSYRPSVRALPPIMARMLDVFCDGQYCGYIGLMAPAMARKITVTGQEYSLSVAELEVTALQHAAERDSWKKEEGLSKLPTITRDLAMVMDTLVPYELLEKELQAAQEPLLKKIIPLDIFMDPTGEKIAVEKKSVTLQLTFQHEDRTLTTQEVTSACDRLIVRLQELLGVEVRS